MCRITFGSKKNPRVVGLLGVNHLSFYYDIGRKELLERHLELLFKTRNPAPSTETSQMFTHMLHDQNLHWYGCTEHFGEKNAKMKKCLSYGEEGTSQLQMSLQVEGTLEKEETSRNRTVVQTYGKDSNCL